MRTSDIMPSFADELFKIAGELHGATRIGRKPIGIERYLEREAEQQSPTVVLDLDTDASATTETTSAESTPEKTASGGLTAAATSAKTLRRVGLVGAGAVGWEGIRRAERDRRVGRQMRLQQGFF